MKKEDELQGKTNIEIFSPSAKDMYKKERKEREKKVPYLDATRRNERKFAARRHMESKFESNLEMPCGKATHFSSFEPLLICRHRTSKEKNMFRACACPQRVIKKLNYSERNR
jgi:hypothetical protein